VTKPPLIFADPPTLCEMLGGKRLSGNQWMALCPCHCDTNPSLSIRRGRNGEILVKCFAACTQKQLLDHFRNKGFTPRPLPPPRPNKPKRPGDATASVAFRACTLSERKMFDLINAGENPTYNGFVDAGVWRGAIPGGLRALEALGLIGVKRASFRVATEDRTVHPDLERFAAKRMGATAVELRSSNVA
jgi:hypothetical protein